VRHREEDVDQAADAQQRCAGGVEAFEVPAARRRDRGGAASSGRWRACIVSPGRLAGHGAYSSIRPIVDGKQLKSTPACCATQ
jgi:hypothetical protein